VLNRLQKLPMNPDPPERPFPIEPVPPELLEYARQTTSEEEFLAHLREMEAEGSGLQLEDFIAEIKAQAGVA
jgi:hypothetical protein